MGLKVVLNNFMWRRVYKAEEEDRYNVLYYSRLVRYITHLVDNSCYHVTYYDTLCCIVYVYFAYDDAHCVNLFYCLFTETKFSHIAFYLLVSVFSV